MMKKIFVHINNSVKTGNLKHKIFCWFLMKVHYSNATLQALEIRNKISFRLRKKYDKEIKKINYDKQDHYENSNYIWICWLQGIDNAPALVRCCYESVKKWAPEKDIIVIDAKTYKKYVSLPYHIENKWEKGIISNAHFSDYIRLELLIKYGGIWMDATVYLTGKIPTYIEESNLFFYQTPTYDLTRKADNWLIVSSKDNRILKTVRDLLCVFWKKESKVKEYFIFHIFLAMAFEKYPSDWSDMIKIPCEIPLMMQKCFFDKYNSLYWNYMTSFTSVHKLTYKVDETLIRGETFYEYILEKDMIGKDGKRCIKE